MDKAIEFVSENCAWFEFIPIVGWAVMWRIYTMAGKNKSWNKY